MRYLKILADDLTGAAESFRCAGLRLRSPLRGGPRARWGARAV